MTVWFAAAIPSSSRGGVNRVMCELSAGLQRRGHRTELVYANTVHTSYLVFSAILAWRLLCVGTNRPDWIIARSCDGVWCALLARVLRLRTRVALHNHGWEEYVAEVEKTVSTAVTNPTTWKARIVRFPLLRATLRWSSLCLSGTIAEMRWLRHAYPLACLGYVPTGVHSADAPYWSNRPAPPHLLFVGGRTWKKDLDYALAVFAQICRSRADARLFVVGSGVDGALTADDSITNVPSESMDAMHAWYAQCPYLLSTSRFEGGHAMAVLEAMAHGAVVFCSSIPSSREVVRDGLNGFVLECAEPAVDAARICHHLARPEASTGIRHAAWRTACRNRWERQVNRLEAHLA